MQFLGECSDAANFISCPCSHQTDIPLGRRAEQCSRGDQKVSFAISDFNIPVDGAHRAAPAELLMYPQSPSCLTQSFSEPFSLHYLITGFTFNLNQVGLNFKAT